MKFIYFFLIFALAEEPHFSTIASLSSLKCHKCIYNDFLIYEKCHQTGFFQNMGNGTISSCIPEDNVELINGLKLLCLLFILSLIFISISIWRKKVLLSR